MLLVSSNFSFQVSPAFVIGFQDAKLDRDGIEELKIESEFQISVHAYPEKMFRDYVSHLAVPFQDPADEIQCYVWISDKNRSCAIAVCADEEIRISIVSALQSCGGNALARIFLMLPLHSEDRKGDRIFVTTAQPSIIIEGTRKQ